MRSRFDSLGSILVLATLCDVAAHAQTVNPLTSGFCDNSAVNDLAVTVATPVTLHTDSDCSYVQLQAGGPDLCVFLYHNIQIESGAVLTVSGMRPATLAAQGTIVVAGTINADQAGGNTGSVSGVDTANASAGGGGAGGATVGGSGGHNFLGASGGIGGLAASPVFAPLIGGSHGGAGGTTNAAAGGRGGGALQLAACGDLTVTGVVRASGQGGSGGAAAAGSPNGGGGGGSGGTLLLEGSNISIFGNVTANGGGGGGGGTTAASGQAGMDGRTDTLSASGGSPGGSGAASGGGGGSTSATGTGGNATSTLGAAGGGGGAVGRIRINACGTLLTAPAAIVSPVASTGSSCPSDRIFADGFE